MRASRAKRHINANLRGLSAKEYYDFERISKTNLVTAARRLLPDNIWTKFDRGKPMSEKHGEQVVDALNEVALEMTPDYPFTTLVVDVVRSQSRLSPGQKRRYLYRLKSISLKIMKTTPSKHGSVYILRKVLKEHDGHKGPVGFSSHAINRLMERVPDIREFAKIDTMVARAALLKTVDEWKVERGDDSIQLQVGPFGFFVMVWDETKNMWVCTTMLERDMKGTAADVQQRMKNGLKELLSKYG